MEGVEIMGKLKGEDERQKERKAETKQQKKITGTKRRGHASLPL